MGVFLSKRPFLSRNANQWHGDTITTQQPRDKTMFIQLTKDQMHQNSGDDLLRCACAIASSYGIENFIEYTEPRTVLVYGVKCHAVFDYVRRGVEFVACNYEEAG
jgi:hypothetical protein